MRFQATPRLWLVVGGEYGSGLPADVGGADPAFLLAQYGPQILNEVNLAGGRAKPNFALDAGVGFEVYRKEQRSALLQIQSANLTDRMNVINFASLFCGTAVAPPTTVSGRVRLTF